MRKTKMISAPSIVAIAATVAVFANVAMQYLDFTSCNEPHPAICKYGFQLRSKKCGNPDSTGLTDDDRANILRTQNSIRAIIARQDNKPPAVQFPELTWDAELEMMAQRWASQCNYGYSQCRYTERFSMTQNIAYMASIGNYSASYTDLMKLWFLDVNESDSNQIKSGTDVSEVGSGTALMSADVKFMGCGGIRYRDDNWYKTYLVCNYGSARN